MSYVSKLFILIIALFFTKVDASAIYNMDESKVVDYFFCISSNHYEEGHSKKEIRAHYTEALKIGRFLVYNLTEVNAEVYSQFGKVHFKLGNMDSAKVWYRKAYLLDTTSGIYLNNMATVTFARADYNEALIYFKKAHEIKKREIDFINNIAACYGSLGQYRKAIKWSMKSLDIDEGSYNALTTYQSLIISYGALGNKKMVRRYKRKKKRLILIRNDEFSYRGSQALCPKPLSALELYGL